jgi:hypothetical protein
MNKKQFFFLLNNAFKITLDGYDNSIFYVWNKSIERQLKYNRLFNRNNTIKYKFNKNDVFFEQDFKNMDLWYNYEKIYLKLEQYIDYKNIDINVLIDINKLIDGWLKDDNNWKVYTPLGTVVITYISLKDDTNWKLYTPVIEMFL